MQRKSDAVDSTTLHREVFPVGSEFATNLNLIELNPGVTSLQGEVSGHRQRKSAEQWVRSNVPAEVINEVELRTTSSISTRQILVDLKKDKYLSGIRFFLQEPAYKPLFCVTLQSDEGVVRLSGRVSDASARSYLETIIWLMPGVKRVINMVSVTELTPVRVDRVVMQAADTLALVDIDLPEDAPLLTRPDRQPSGSVAAIAAGTREVFFKCSASLRSSTKSGIENIAWAVPEVSRVTMAA